MEKKHSCRICGQTFLSGRSLGRHIRSHVVLGSSMASKEKLRSGYHLRDNPMKSRRLNDSLEKKEIICASLGKRSSPEIPIDKNRECSEEEMQSQSTSDVTAVSTPMMKSLSRSGPIAEISSSYSSYSPPDCSPEYDNEQEDCAMCLLMLSRSAGSVKDSSDQSLKVPSPPSESGFSLDNSNHGDLGSADLKFGKTNSSNQCNIESKMPNYSKNNSRYECPNCRKCFNSYQALGGHRANHRRTNGQCRGFNNQNHGFQLSGNSPENPRTHECSICGKNFASGQALGGHKRSHFAVENNSPDLNAAEQEDQKGSKLNLIDLNLPGSDDF